MKNHCGVDIISAIEPIARTGMVFDTIEPNQLVLRMPLAGNANHTGIMYAGSLFTLAECAAGALFLNRYGDDRIMPICAGVDIRFRAPATNDIKLTISITDEQFSRWESEALNEGKARVEFEEQLVDINGDIVATANVKYVLLKKG